eukprot:GFKZ01000363.1.p1 GENE.GFKZ01000363.1~~GFKZ01000363.1.p1  ORF type:complete len:487 (+),score=60.22 GFKZ01000363.1:49-1461(+)
MSNSNTASDLSTARKPRPKSSSDLTDEFLATITLYKTLACRFQTSRPFLPRTLWRQAASVRQIPPTVLYQSGHTRVKWRHLVKRMRCLWCRDKFFRFANMHELIQHLRTCHARFQYRAGGTFSLNVAGKTRTVEVIYMKLVEGDDCRRFPAVDCFKEPVDDAIYVGPKRNMTTSPASSAELVVQPGSSSGVKRSAEAVNNSGIEPAAKRQRPVRACASSSKVVANGVNGNETRRPLRSRSEVWEGNGKGRENGHAMTHGKSNGKVRKGEGKHGKKSKVVKSKVASAKLAYQSVAQAVKERRLYHSVLQTPVKVEEVEGGEDSDAEEKLDYEREWRLALANTEVDDFSDTLPVEKLFFNLWNQFLTIDFHTYCDRMVAPACMQFVKKYRRIIHQLHMELIFMRHLIELRRVGLLGASAVYETMMVLKDRDTEAKSKEEEEAKFFYLDELKRKAAERETNNHKKPDAGRPVV